MKLHEKPINSISDVWDIYREDFKRVEAQIIEDLDSEVSLINDVGYHLLKGGGQAVQASFDGALLKALRLSRRR